jgi:Protein of unknown function (DUF3352)
MKNIRQLVSLIAACGLALVLVSSCKKHESSSEPLKTVRVASAQKTSFNEVTSQLDPGGTFYLYLSTEQWLDGVSGKISGWRQLFTSMPDVEADARANINKGFDLVTNLIKNSGIEDISGVGMSSVAREDGIYHSKAFAHHYSGKGSGFLWKMFGQKPHALDGLDLLPENTALAVFSDLDVPLLWSVVEKEVAKSGFPQAKDVVNKLPAEFQKATGMKWDKLLDSLDGEFGIILTLDPSNKIPIPIPGKGGLEIPEPGLMIIAKVSDDTIFDRLDQALKDSKQRVERVDERGLQMRTMTVPVPVPIRLRPTVTTSDGFLFIATSDALVKEALAVKSGKKPGLKSTEEFQQLSRDIPQQGNQFSYISRNFSETAMQIQQQVMAMQGKMQPAQMKWMQSLMQPDKATFMYTVSANSDQGWLTVGNGSQNPAQMLGASAIVLPIGLLSAVAVPNFVKARQTAQFNSCINNLRQIDGAKQQWALENKKPQSAKPTQSDLKAYFRNGQFPVCPQGGVYTINSIGQPPRCNIPGHELKF